MSRNLKAAFGIGKADKGKQKKKDFMFNSLFKFASSLPGVRVRTIDDKDLSIEDNIIALMGPTGTGKSSFIEIVTSKSGLTGHSLESFTKNISIIRFTFPEIVDSDICFVDTPGFDDTHGSDEKTLKAISSFIVDTHKRKLKLTGLLYFHRISDNRMSGSLLRNLRYFEDLCGNEFKKMIFITTMWDQTEQAQGEQHERQLRDEYWKPILEMGSSTRRFLHERSSAFDVLSPYFDEINRKSFNRLQVEVRDIALKLLLLGDGQRLSVELKRAISRRQETLQRIRAELRKPSLNEAEIGGLIDSYEKGFEELSRVAAELERLEIETSKHFKRVVWRMKWDQVISLYPRERTGFEESTEDVHGEPANLTPHAERDRIESEQEIPDGPDRELEYQSTDSDASSEVDQPEVEAVIILGGDIVEAESSDLWQNDDQPSDEDEEEAIDSEEDELMQEPESRKVVCDSVHTEARAGDLESDGESDFWEEFEVWKEEEERIEYERWYEGRKEYEEFERWTAHEQVGGDWDDREEWSDISKSAGDDDWSLFEQWQESEQRRAFNWLVEQEKHWMIFKNETYLDSEDVRYNQDTTRYKFYSDKVVGGLLQ